MRSSVARFRSATGARGAIAAGLLSIASFGALGCGGLSKSDALEIVRRDVHEDAECILPVTTLSKLKVQYTTKAACAPKADPGANEPTAACLDALIAAGATKAMSPSYMSEWPDEISGVGFDSVSPYDRKARSLLFSSCVELRGLREGRFKCGEAKADRVVKVMKTGDTTASVQYARAITLDPSLVAIDAACGAVSRPAPEATVVLEKTDKTWSLSHDDGSGAPSSSASASTPRH